MNNNLRIINDNAADRGVITASGTSGALLPANLQNDIKSAVWRVPGNSASLQVDFPTTELVGGVALPFCNFTSAAMLRVIGYDGFGVTVFDTGSVPACTYAPLGSFDWGLQAIGGNAYRRGGANDFAYGAGACASVWFAHALVRSLAIGLFDPHNPDGYLEASRLVAGSYWSPHYNADYGAALLLQDASKHYRSDAGDLLTDVGTRSRKLSFNLGQLPPSERTRLMTVLRGNGMSRPVFVSLFPESDDPLLEQDHQIYGKLPEVSAVSIPSYNTYCAPLALEEI